MTKRFDPTKPVRTRDGRPARILCIDRKVGCGEFGKYQVFALVTTARGGEEAFVYTMDGCYYTGQESVHDLINVPVKKSGWVNVYPAYMNKYDAALADSGGIYPTKDAADKYAMSKRIACTYIEWEE